MPTFATSFCNQAHSLKTGKPIGHDCYTIPPRLLKMEANLSQPQGDAIFDDNAWKTYHEANEAMRDAWGEWSQQQLGTLRSGCARIGCRLSSPRA